MLNLRHLSDLLRAAGPGKAWQAFAVFAGDLGFDRIIRYDLSQDIPTVLTTFGDDWQRHYQDRDYSRIDPFFEHCCKPGIPVATGAAYLDDYDYLAPAQRKLVLEAREAGFNAGFSLVLPDQDTCAWNIGSSLPRSDVEALRAELARTLPLALRMVSLHLNPGPALTAREAEVMLLLAAGNRVPEIAHALGLAVVTVDLHLRNARTKLGARTRDQALLNFALGAGGSTGPAPATHRPQ